MTRSLFAASAFALAVAMAQPAFAQDAEAEFVELREEVWEWTLDNSPELATSIGDRRGDGQLGDNSLAGVRRAPCADPSVPRPARSDFGR